MEILSNTRQPQQLQPPKQLLQQAPRLQQPSRMHVKLEIALKCVTNSACRSRYRDSRWNGWTISRGACLTGAFVLRILNFSSANARNPRPKLN